MKACRSQSGFSLIELMIATALFLIVSAIVTTALMQMTSSQKTIWNRTEMHSGVRGATELMQQEVGQAGRVSLPTTTADPNRRVTLGSAVTGVSPCTIPVPVTLSATSGTPTDGMFDTESLTILDGDNQESVAITVTSGTTVTACFTKNHAVGAAIAPLGGFATGIIPMTGIVNGSTWNVLKMYGDINGDGSLVYVEYYCDNGDAGTDGTHNLYRRVMAYNAGLPKPAQQILLSNIFSNPGGTHCFEYQPSTITVNGTAFTFVLNVAITLTVRTEQIDPITRDYQFETKALLNVSPRNVFNAWELAGIGYSDRIQSTPVSVTTLLPWP